jgi:hypothetical protein
LAKELGKTLSEVMSWPSSELTKWSAFFSVEPMRETKDDIRFAMLRHSIYNSSSKTFGEMDTRDLLPFWARSLIKITPEEQQENLDGLKALFGKQKEK